MTTHYLTTDGKMVNIKIKPLPTDSHVNLYRFTGKLKNSTHTHTFRIWSATLITKESRIADLWNKYAKNPLFI